MEEVKKLICYNTDIIVSHFLAGDKKYWKCKYDKVIEEFKPICKHYIFNNGCDIKESGIDNQQCLELSLEYHVMTFLGVYDIQRFRKGFIIYKDGITHISFYCRTGGNNRDDFPNTELAQSTYLISDKDDEYDNTYNNYLFEIPNKYYNGKIPNKYYNGKII